MGKRTSAFLCVLLCALGGAVFVKFGKETGHFRKAPEAAYLSDSEAASRPAYKQLNDKERAIYEALYRGITEKQEFIPLPFEVDGDTYSKVYCLLEKQEGKFFYLGSSYYTAEKIREAQIVYRDEIGKADEKMADVEKAEHKALTAIKRATGDYNKIMAINDYIVNNCTYVSGADREYSPTVYGCLVEQEANCEGYAKTFDMLAAEVGLESCLITGITDKGENHAWNQVKADGEWYNIDVTWGDTDEGDDVRRAYFLCTDEDFLGTHTADGKYFKPHECTATKDNYYVKNGLFVETESDAVRIIQDCVRSNKSVIEMKFADDMIYNDFKQKYITEQEIFQLLTENGMQFEGDMTVSIKEGDGDRCISLFLK